MIAFAATAVMWMERDAKSTMQFGCTERPGIIVRPVHMAGIRAGSGIASRQRLDHGVIADEPCQPAITDAIEFPIPLFLAGSRRQPDFKVDRRLHHSNHAAEGGQISIPWTGTPRSPFPRLLLATVSASPPGPPNASGCPPRIPPPRAGVTNSPAATIGPKRWSSPEF